MKGARSVIAFLLLGILWGSSFVAIEVGIPFFPPILFAALRYYIAGMAILVYALFTVEYQRPRSSKDWIVIAITGIFLIGGHHALLYIGQQYVSGAVAAIVISLSPILTTAFATLFLDDSLTFFTALGLLFGLSGVVLVTNPTGSTVLTVSVIGIGFVFASAACFGLGSVLTRPFRTSMPVQSMQAYSMLFGALLLHGVSFCIGEDWDKIIWTMSAVASLGYLAIVSGAFAFLLYFQLLDHYGPVEINLIGYFEPVTAAILSWIIFGQLINLPTIGGFILILVGFITIKRRSIKGIIESCTLCYT
ncbi:EamA/RhaT family transporter [halophilic archaeon]|nr:EamA/RhaT family transporter [halophilic archaeon]